MAKKDIVIDTDISTNEELDAETTAKRYGKQPLKSSRGPRTKKFIVSMPESLHYEIMAIAKAKDLSVNNLINDFLEEYAKENAEDVKRYEEFVRGH